MDVSQLKPLPALCFDDLTPARSRDKDYFAFYGIDFENRLDGVEHFFGALPVAGHQIATHYYCQASRSPILYVMHGYFDHVGLFSHIIDWGLQQGYAVVAFDLPGHGLSDGEEASISDFEQYRKVLEGVLKLTSCCGDGPYHLVAQSTGCAIVMDYLQQTSYRPFEKMVFLAPLVRPVHWWWIRLQMLLGRGTMQTVKRRFVRNSHDEEFLQFLAEQDSLQARIISVPWLHALKMWIKRFHTAQPISGLSLMVIQGTGDGTVDWRYNLRLIERKFPGLILHKISHARHHMANESEPIRREFLSLMEAYLLQGKNLLQGKKEPQE